MFFRSFLLSCATLLAVTTGQGQVEPVAFDWIPIVAKARSAVLFLKVSRAGTDTLGTGTGFLISTSGLFVTSWHVVKEATAITAVDTAGRRFQVRRVVGENPRADLALLAIEGAGFSSLALGSSSQMEPGAPVAMLDEQVNGSAGVVSAVRELFGETMIQISNRVVGGNSGAPIVNRAGEVVGICNGFLVGQTAAQNISCAIPVEAAKRLLDQPLAEAKYFRDHAPRPQLAVMTIPKP